MTKVWFITGAGRGMGTDIAKAALAAGHKVVATGRNTDKVTQAVGESAELLVVKLDVTNPADAEAAVKAAIDRFGRVDVLVNNAGNFYAGFFEEVSPEDFRAQVETNLFGPVNVTRAALPVMRAQRSGLVVTISSSTPESTHVVPVSKERSRRGRGPSGFAVHATSGERRRIFSTS